MNLYRIYWKNQGQASKQWYASSAEDIRNMLILAKQLFCEADEVYVYEPQSSMWVKVPNTDDIPVKPEAFSSKD